MMCLFIPPVVAAPTTSYANTGGMGDRTASITATSSFSGTPLDTGTPSNMVDGGFNGNSSDCYYRASGTANWADGDYLQFDFTSLGLRYINEVKLTSLAIGDGYPGGNWKFVYSQDGTNFVDLNTFAWTSLILSQAVTGMPAEGCLKLRIKKVGASSADRPIIAEVEFKIAPGA